MRHLVQRPCLDELLSSVLVRTCRHAGLPVGTVMRALTNGRKWQPGFFQAGHVVEFAEVLGMAPMDLLWRHTVFPYATAFFEPAVYAGALQAALSTGAEAVGMGAVTQSVSDLVRLRRYCRVCASVELRRWGESYWHREHNLPGVLVCLAHRRVLWEAPLRASAGRSWSIELPHEVNGVRVLARTAASLHWRLAELSVAQLHRSVGAQAPRDAAWYREALVATGLLSEARQVSGERLVAWARERFVAAQRGGTATGRNLGFREREAALHWMALMVRPRVRIPFVPLKHVLFEALVVMEPAAGITEAASAQAGVLDHAPPGPSGRDATELDKAYRVAVRRVLRRYRNAGERVRVHDLLTEAGCWSAYRHARNRFPRVEALMQRLRGSELSVRRVRED